MDLPAVCEVAGRYIAEGEVRDRVTTVPVDMFRETWPTGHDGVFLSNIFHDWNVTTNTKLARAAFNALPSGGKIFLHEMLMDEATGGPLTTAAFSMLMLLGTQGKQYAFRELAEMLKEAGFADIAAHKTYGYYSIVSGVKP